MDIGRHIYQYDSAKRLQMKEIITPMLESIMQIINKNLGEKIILNVVVGGTISEIL